MQHFLLEQALNYLIEQSQSDLAPLNDKNIDFALEEPTLRFDFFCTNNRIFVTNESINADVDIKLKSSVFLALLQGAQLSELLKKDQIIIHGDVKTTQLLVDLLQQLGIDWEELLSKYTGDIIAHQLGKAANRFKANMQNANKPLATLKDELTTLLVAPAQSGLFNHKGV